ncbi:MAG: glutamate-5-semialdehyde dehydrogenase [Candidatus Omnitrophota bacterium]
MKLKTELIKIARNAQDAFRGSASISSPLKRRVLKDMSSALMAHKNYIIAENKKDLSQARSKGLTAAFIDRLTLNEKTISQMSSSLSEIAKLKDPVGEIIKSWKTLVGLNIQKVRVPIGVIAIIYESRPNVTSDCIGLCFKSGNSVILRGGSESLKSNLAIFEVLRKVLKIHRINENLINMITTADRKAVDELLKLDAYIDLVMPRGGEALIRKVAQISRIPVIKHYKGICHVYVDKYADLNQALQICLNAKVQRPGVCNAMESMLVHQDIAAKFLPVMAKIFNNAKVQLRGCAKTLQLAPFAKAAIEKDYHTEYLGLILSVKVVRDIHQAIRHVNYYGSHHSDSIISKNKANVKEFLRLVDSACVYANASTRFTDGNQFGMGAEIGISTDKLHARGPMALEELTTYKYVIHGNGQVRSS